MIFISKGVTYLHGLFFIMFLSRRLEFKRRHPLVNISLCILTKVRAKVGDKDLERKKLNFAS